METYFRGELYTYSYATLKHLKKDCEKALAEGKNLEMVIDDEIARAYGYSSAREYEEYRNNRNKRTM